MPIELDENETPINFPEKVSDLIGFYADKASDDDIIQKHFRDLDREVPSDLSAGVRGLIIKLHRRMIFNQAKQGHLYNKTQGTRVFTLEGADLARVRMEFYIEYMLGPMDGPRRLEFELAFHSRVTEGLRAAQAQVDEALKPKLEVVKEKLILPGE